MAEDDAFETLLAQGRKLAGGKRVHAVYEEGSRALVRCLDASAQDNSAWRRYKDWPNRNKHALLSQLLLQDGRVEEPNVLLHTACSFASSGVAWVMPALAGELSALLRELLNQSPPPRDAVLAVVNLRESLAADWSQAEISALHREHFHRFTAADMALPYSVMFREDLYHRNREDLQIGPANVAKLKLTHLAVLEWLTGRPFTTFEGAEADALPCLATHTPSGEGPEADVERAAGRALVSRHLQDASEAAAFRDSDLVARLRATPAMMEVAGSLVQARQRLSDASSGAGNPLHRSLEHLVSKKPYMALQVVKNEVRSRVASRLPRARRRPRLALCVSGQLRGYERAFATWQRSFLHGIDYDIYVHTWRGTGHSGAEPHRASLPFEGEAFQKAYREHCLGTSHEQVKARYPTLFWELSQTGTADAGALRDLYGTEHVVVEDDAGPEFEGWSNQQKMHYKIHACSELAYGSGKSYDLVMRLRPDLPIKLQAFGWRDAVYRCRAMPLLMAETAFGLHYAQPTIGDQLALGAPETMRVYASTYELHDRLAPHGLFKYPEQLAGHLSLAYTCWLHGIRVERLPVKMEPLADAEPLSLATVQRVIHQDADGRNDADDQKLLAALAEDSVR